MNLTRFLPLLLAATVAVAAGCASPPAAPPVRYTYASTEQLQAGAQAVADAFAAEVARVRGEPLAAAPRVEVRNTPMLIFFSSNANTITVPWWDTQPAEMRAVFRQVAAGDDAKAEQLFRVFFNAFLVAHEAGHWFQFRAQRREPTLYQNENQANRLAVAFWRSQPGGEAYLAQLEQLAERAATTLPNPTPAGQDPVAYFGANYQTLGREPLKYGYYQFRFMADALRERGQLDFARMVGK